MVTIKAAHVIAAPVWRAPLVLSIVALLNIALAAFYGEWFMWLGAGAWTTSAYFLWVTHRDAVSAAQIAAEVRAEVIAERATREGVAA